MGLAKSDFHKGVTVQDISLSLSVGWAFSRTLEKCVCGGGAAVTNLPFRPQVKCIVNTVGVGPALRISVRALG